MNTVIVEYNQKTNSMAATKDKYASIEELLKSVKSQQENLESYQDQYDNEVELRRTILRLYREVLEADEENPVSYHESVNLYSHEVNHEVSKSMGDAWLDVYRSFYDSLLNSLRKTDEA